MGFTRRDVAKLFSPGYTGKAFIIAELSANHNGSLARAKDTIRAAADSGADAVKLQTYTAETMTIDCGRPPFVINQGTLWDGQTLFALYKKAYTPWEWHDQLFSTAQKCGVLCFSTPFDRTAVDFLERFDPPVTKIASFEANDTPLIAYAASKGRPMLISTGLSDEAEVRDAAAACRRAGNRRLALLKCVSAYPALPEESNLLTIPDMAKRFRVTPGLSDHTLGTEAACAAVALGGKIIEKHFILSRKHKGPDAPFSTEPAEFRRLVDSIRVIEKALGKVTYTPGPRSARNMDFKRSLFAVADIIKGEIFTDENVRSIRPAYGLPPKNLPKVIGRRAAGKISRGTPLTWAHLKK
ncbi:MAG: pseudaminic acid synthase [Elusimicrobiales bacterium]|nr:pseudaminic acid synthase [Elusimicrobiales bacterium]